MAPITDHDVDHLDAHQDGVAYRAAIVGTGFMGRVHARAVHVAGGRVAGVVGSNVERAKDSLADMYADQVFGSLEEALDSRDVDVVHVCTPNHLHEPVALAAVAAGKHVVCEKPLSTSAASAAAMTTAAEEAGSLGVVPFVYRFHPMVREARAKVRGGEIGRVFLAHGSYLQDWMLRPDDDNWRVDPDLGGPTRAFGDIGSHWCDLMEFVTGERIASLSAQSSRVNERRGAQAPREVTTEDMVIVQFATESGSVGTVVISQVSAGRKNRLLLEVSGSQGSFCFDQENPEVLWWGGRDRSSMLVRDGETLSPDAARYVRVPAGHPQGYQDCFDALVADTRAAIGGQMPDGLPTFADGLRSAQVADAVVTSARERTWVEVGP
ncbi:gfo/Idh/MocA family oxidoreductase [Actinobacteria bacterium YIM 96077]|uniref:Gfo/Idh/MocA family oxidoreductase n=1 Tax=Phytoactinopolyspora halophila TaxID=1981511 RepID=A0A329QHY3_9ACTN|nr:gfo/Idh/MocA family oxidoreductase [Actinobacteria bacterium YIM 96077]RAW09998.1 gfo/Idh/MocA family oxidoreductase [Phytoactinopolyspora halophila]